MTDSRWRALLFSGAFLARLVSWLGAAIFGTDSCHYLLMADWMKAGRFQDALSVAYHPMYPLLIATATPFAASTEQAGASLSILLGAAAILPLYALVRELFGRPVAAITALMYAFSPAIIEVQSDVMTEGTYFFFLFSAAWLTWRMTEAPSPALGVVLGASAAAAFLTRPEGLLAIVLALVWPVAGLIRRRAASGPALAGIGLVLVTVILLLSPYLLWVRAERGHWGLSVRPSAISAEQAVGVIEEGGEVAPQEGKSRLYTIYAVSLFRLSMYGLLLPFFVIGAVALRRSAGFRLLFYLSYPAGLLGGILIALRTHTFMSERYVMAGYTLLSAVAGLGMVSVVGDLLRRWPASRRVPVLCQSFLILLLVVPMLKCLKVRRQELMSYPVAGRWILAHGPQPKAVVGLEQVAYYSGSRSYYAPSRREPLLEMLGRQPVDYLVYSEKDVRTRPEYVAMLRSLDRLEPAAEVEGPPGTWKVYIHRVK